MPQYLIFPWLWERSWIWSLSFHLYNSGGWLYGKLIFFESLRVRMPSGTTNLKNNNSRTRRLSNGYCTCIPIIQLHSIFKLLQIDFWVFVDRHTCFCITIVLPVVLASRVRKLVAIYQIYLWSVVYYDAGISIMSCYSMVPLINSPISWTFGVTPRLITLCSGGICSRIGLLPIFSNVTSTSIVQKTTPPP
jgi:hypothetical protein